MTRIKESTSNFLPSFGTFQIILLKNLTTLIKTCNLVNDKNVIILKPINSFAKQNQLTGFYMMATLALNEEMRKMACAPQILLEFSWAI